MHGLAVKSQSERERMSAGEAFFDTSVPLYLFSADTEKADHTEELPLAGGVLCVPLFSEFTSVASRKLRTSHSGLRVVGLVSRRYGC